MMNSKANYSRFRSRRFRRALLRAMVASATITGVNLSATPSRAQPDAAPEQAATQQADAALLQAVSARDRAQVARLLTSPAPSNGRDEYGRTLLYLATETGQVDMVTLLLEKGADINARNGVRESGFYERHSQKTPLQAAFDTENPGLLALLIERGADLKAPWRIGFNEQSAGDLLLGLSAAWDNAPLVKLLLSKGADAKARGAATLAVRGGNPQIVKMLLDAGAPVNPPAPRDGDDERGIVTLLQGAARDGSREIVELLLNAGADASIVGAQDTTALGEAVEGGHASVVALLLERGASPNPPARGIGATPLARAIRNGDRALAEMLLKSGATFARDDRDGAAMLNAAASGTVAQIEAQAANSLNARDRDGTTALHIASFLDRGEAVAALLKAGASANTSDERGRTALHLAALGGSAKAVEQLLESGADASVRDRLGETPLHLAAFNGSGELVSALLKEGADARARLEVGDAGIYEKGVTALHRAAQYNNVSAMRALLSNSDLDARTQSGATPLHFAARSGAVDAVTLLLSKNAPADVPNTFGRTPLLEAVRPSQDLFKSLWSHPAPRPVAAFSAGKSTSNASSAATNAENATTKPVLPDAMKPRAPFDRATVVTLLLRAGASAKALPAPPPAPDGAPGRTPLEPLLEAVRGIGRDFDAGLGGDLAGGAARQAAFERDSPVRARIVASLLAKGASPNARLQVNSYEFYRDGSGGISNLPGPTALHLATEAGDVEVVKLLLAKGAEVNAEDGVGRTPFDWLIRRGEASSRRLDVPFAPVSFNLDRASELPPTLADPAKKRALVAALRAKNAHSGVGPLLMAISNRAESLATALLKEAPELAGRRAMGGVTSFGGGTVGYVVTGTEVDTATPLGAAIFSKQNALAKAMAAQIPPLNKNAKNAKNEATMSALMNAALSAQNWEIVDLLLARGATLTVSNESGDTPLHVAARNGDLQGATQLLQRGADVNAWNKDARTPLNIAKAEGEKAQAVASLLQERGGRDENITELINSNPDAALKLVQSDPRYARATFNNGDTLLHSAVSQSRDEIVAALLKGGANPNARGRYGDTPLHKTLQNDNDRLARILLQSGANPNFDPDAGHPVPTFATPDGVMRQLARPVLVAAARENRLKVAKVLLEGGARPDAKDIDGLSALQAATNNNFSEMITLLREALNVPKPATKPRTLPANGSQVK